MVTDYVHQMEGRARSKIVIITSYSHQDGLQGRANDLKNIPHYPNFIESTRRVNLESKSSKVLTKHRCIIQIENCI